MTGQKEEKKEKEKEKKEEKKEEKEKKIVADRTGGTGSKAPKNGRLGVYVTQVKRPLYTDES